MEWKAELSLWTKTILTRGSEFLMAWTRWSQTWTTKSRTTTTSRKPQKCISKTALKSNARAFASRSKAKAKPQTRTSASSSTKTVPICERSWTDVEPGTYSPIAYPVSKRLSTLLRHGSLPREEDGAIEFWIFLKDYLRNEFERSQHWFDEMWKSRMAGGGGNKKRFQYCTDSSGQEILYLRALQGHLGRNPIDPSLQDNVLIPNNVFEYIYHIGCAINLYSITNSGLIPGGQHLSKRQTLFFTSVDPMGKEHKDPETVDMKAPRIARCLQTAWDIKTRCVGLKFYRTRSNDIVGKRTWTDIEPQEYSLTDFSVSKKLINLLRHGSLPREDDGAIEFWRTKEYLQNNFGHSRFWSDEKWKSSMARGGGNKKRDQYCFDSSGAILYLRALQGHSGRSLIDPSLQDNVIIPDGFFQYIYHVRCAINLHSIISSGLIPGGQSLSKRQTVFFLPVDPMDKNHKDPDVIDLSVPRRAQYVHKAWKRHQDAVYWVDINLAIEKGLKFYQTR